MKRNTFAALFVATHVTFIFMHIYRQTLVVRETFRKQKNERTLELLTQRQQELTTQLCCLKNHMEIKRYAQQELGMQPITLKQVRRVAAHDKTT